VSLTFEIRVLGNFAVLRDGVAVSLPQSRKTRALLAYLSVLGTPQRRERLCELFWDLPNDPRGALRWSLSQLRQSLNTDGKTRLEADRNNAGIKKGSLSLDYDMIRGLAPNAVDALPTEKIEKIAAAFSGPFLADLYLPHCAGFEAWRVYSSNETEFVRLKVLRALLDRLVDEPERALVYAHTLQSLVPDENLAKEVSKISERARQLVARGSGNSAGKAVAGPLPRAAQGGGESSAETVEAHLVAETTGSVNEMLQGDTDLSIDQKTRRLATILSADFASIGYDLRFPEAALDVLDPLLAKAGELVRANRGTLLSASENGFTASFGAPEPLEDHAAFACRAGLEFRNLVKGLVDTGIGVRIAIDTGMVIVSTARDATKRQKQVRGGPVSVAHSLSQGLRHDLVIATERTRSSAGGLVTTQPLSLSTPSIFAKGQLLHEVTGLNRGRSRWQVRAERRLSPFIGRDVQLQMLNKAWADARDGEGQVLVILGDPGIGKSRLTHEFIGAISRDKAERLEAHALETDLRSGFVVIRKVLQWLFDVTDTDSPAAAVEKVRLQWVPRDFDQRLLDPILAMMELPVTRPLWTALSGEERGRRMQEGAVAFLLALSRRKPVVLLVEDLQWIDLESETALLRLAQTVPSTQFLLVLTCRPEYDRGPFSLTNPVEIRLSPLNPADAGALLDHLVGRDPELTQLRGTVLKACKGNALFLEETIHALAESGKLEGEPGRYRAAGEIGSIVISSNIHSIIDARFERLDEDSKRVAEVASIFGDQIPMASLRRIAALCEQRFEAALQVLRKADLLVDVEVFPDPLLRFKHGLIRQVVGERIVSSAQVELHRSVFAELKAYYAERHAEHSERLAAHAAQAQLWDEAAQYLLISAGKAIRRSAHVIALQQLDLGIRLLRNNDVASADRREIDFQLVRGVALMAARGWGSNDVLAAFERAEELCEKVADDTRLFTALRGRAQYYMISGKPEAAQAVACRCAGLVKDRKDPGLTIETEHMFWTNNFFLGEIAASHSHAERAIALYDPGRDHHLTFEFSGHDPGVCSRCFAALSAWLAGDPAKARERCQEALTLAERLHHPLTTALAHWGSSYLSLFAGEPERARQAAENELQISEEFQFPLLSGQAMFQMGWARFWLGEREPGLKCMEQAMTAIRQTGAEMGLSYFMALHAEALAHCGRLDDAGKAVAAALDHGHANGTYFQLAEVLRIEACIRDRSGAEPEEFEQMLRKAADVADSQCSGLSQLRTAVELARLFRRRRQARKARDILASHSELIERLGDSRDARAARELL
jgi:class 3 adenylate cyclase/tetratricopeptide (TPR) repeat protein